MRRLLTFVLCLCVIQALSGATQADSCPLYPMGFQGGFVTYYALRSSPACQQPHMFMGPFGLTSNCSDPSTCQPTLVPDAKARVRAEVFGTDAELTVGMTNIEVPEATVLDGGWVKKVKSADLVYFKLTPDGDPIYLQLHSIKADPTNYDFKGLNEDVKKKIKDNGIQVFNFGHEVNPENADDYKEIQTPTGNAVIKPGFHYVIKYRGRSYSTVIQQR